MSIWSNALSQIMDMTAKSAEKGNIHQESSALGKEYVSIL